jgi:hypothetical protein
VNANDICRRVLKSRAFQRTKRFLTNHGADIFSVLAGIGVIATGISAYELGKTRAEILDDSERSSISKRSTIATTKTIIFGAGTIGCIYSARHFGKLKEESLLAACSVLASYSARKRGSGQTDVASGESDNVWNNDSAKLTSAIEDTGYGDIIFTEDLTGRKFKSSLESVYSAIDLLQDEFERHNFVPLNSFYAYLGLQPTSAGDILGWSVNQSILDPYLDEIEYNDMKDALTDLNIYPKEYPCIGWVIHYPVMPIGGIAGVGPCNY